jgi:AhpD family alkylhydroperoxidase
MSEEVKAYYDEFKRSYGKMQKEVPALTGGFGKLYDAAMSEGALTVAEKEAVAIGIAVAIQCSPCIYLHVKGGAKAGLRRAQILDAAGVALMMGGGPASTHIPEVLKALDACEVE